MSGRLSRSWELMKNSLSVIRKDKELLMFPLISGIIMILIGLTFIGGLFFTSPNFIHSHDFVHSP
uniref:Uncharacterized protein n=1 Tax=Candidatus Methanophagaceae archaeon ANME-1 ERB6 TaxID=2759912 RepID=A0A7G9YWK9_9EURY|nr:hypothetical protein IAKEDICC_00014 [Methanosarcinales archaeon ANME-1 ERB6]